MAIRIVAVIVLLAYGNCLLGCSSTVRIDVDEIRQQENVEFPEQEIIKAELYSGDTVYFDHRRGHYDDRSEVFFGYDMHGEKVAYPADNVRRLTVSNIASPTNPESTPFALSYISNFEKHHRRIISQIELSDGDTIKFDKQGGRLFSGLGMVSGTIKDSTFAEFTVEDVQSVVISKSSRSKTGLLVMSLVIGAALTAFVIIASVEGLGPSGISLE